MKFYEGIGKMIVFGITGAGLLCLGAGVGCVYQKYEGENDRRIGMSVENDKLKRELADSKKEIERLKEKAIKHSLKIDEEE